MDFYWFWDVGMVVEWVWCEVELGGGNGVEWWREVFKNRIFLMVKWSESVVNIGFCRILQDLLQN